MQKKQLAVVVASLLGFSSAQAATLYDQEGTKLDIYGRIAMGVAGGDPEVDDAGHAIDDGAEFVDVYSRLEFRMSHSVTSNLTAFGHLEWRFSGDEGNTHQGFNEIRQSSPTPPILGRLPLTTITSNVIMKVTAMPGQQGPTTRVPTLLMCS